MTSPNIIINVNSRQKQIRMGYTNPDRKKEVPHEKTEKYIDKMIDYFSNPKKAPLNFKDFLENEVQPEDSYANLAIGYDKKNDKTIFAKKSELKEIKNNCLKNIEHSNLNQVVISFENSFINENISIEELYKLMAKTIIPTYLEQIGYDPNLIDYQFSLHTDTDNMHFHLAFMEKEPAYTSRWSKEHQYRRYLKIDDSINNDIKSLIQRKIEEKTKYYPLLNKVDESIKDLRNEYSGLFPIPFKNYIFEHANDFRIEEEFVRLGKLLNEERKNKKGKVSYGSIQNQEIKDLTQDIYNSLFSKHSKDDELFSSFNEAIENFNLYIKETYRANNAPIPETNAMVTKKSEELKRILENFIVNNSLYDYRKSLSEQSKQKQKIYFLQELAYQNFCKTKFPTKPQIFNNYIKMKNEYYQEKKTFNNFAVSEYGCLPNLDNIKYYLNQINRKRMSEVRSLQGAQIKNIYDERYYRNSVN